MFRATILAGLILVGLAVQSRADVLRGLSYGPHPKQEMDVYLPQDPRNAPILVMLHGGAWAFGDKENPGVYASKVAHWGAMGWIFVSVNTRLLPDADPVAQTHDLARAMRFAQRNAGSWGGDTSRLALMGHSAGAHVAMLLATRDDIQRNHAVRPWRATISLDTAALDVRELMARNPGRVYRNAFGTSLSYWLDASPITHATRDMPPALLVCSTHRTLSCQAATALARRGPATVLRVGLSHAEINRDLGLPGPYTAAVDSWLRRHGFP